MGHASDKYDDGGNGEPKVELEFQLSEGQCADVVSHLIKSFGEVPKGKSNEREPERRVQEKFEKKPYDNTSTRQEESAKRFDSSRQKDFESAQYEDSPRQERERRYDKRGKENKYDDSSGQREFEKGNRGATLRPRELKKKYDENNYKDVDYEKRYENNSRDREYPKRYNEDNLRQRQSDDSFSNEEFTRRQWGGSNVGSTGPRSRTRDEEFGRQSDDENDQFVRPRRGNNGGYYDEYSRPQNEFRENSTARKVGKENRNVQFAEPKHGHNRNDEYTRPQHEWGSTQEEQTSRKNAKGNKNVQFTMPRRANNEFEGAQNDWENENDCRCDELARPRHLINGGNRYTRNNDEYGKQRQMDSKGNNECGRQRRMDSRYNYDSDECAVDESFTDTNNADGAHCTDNFDNDLTNFEVSGTSRGCSSSKKSKKRDKKLRKQMAQDCKRAAKTIVKRCKNEEKIRKNEAKKIFKQFKKEQKLKKKEFKHILKDKKNCEKVKEKLRRQHAKAKIAELKTKMKIKCQMMKTQGSENCL